MGSRRIYGISYLIKYLINNYVTASMQSIRSTRHWTHSLAFSCIVLSASLSWRTASPLHLSSGSDTLRDNIFLLVVEGLNYILQTSTGYIEGEAQSQSLM